MANTEMEKLVNLFIKNAVIQGEATLSSDYKKGNKASDKLFKIRKTMKKDICIAKAMLDILLEHENVNVKIWAAGDALDLKYREEEAEQILKAISEMSDIGILAFNASMSLKVRKNKDNEKE